MRHRLAVPTCALVTSLALTTVPGISPSAQAKPRLETDLALRALGPLGPSLEAEGWTLTPSSGSTLALGDVIDPEDQQVQLLGTDCFTLAGARQGAGVSAEVNRALAVEGGLPLGGVGVRARVSGSINIQVRDPQIEEIATASLRPSAACVSLLRTMAADGVAIDRYEVVQSVLRADLSIAGCAETAASAGAGLVGVGASTEASACSDLSGTRAVIARRVEGLGDVLSRAGVALDSPLADGVPARRRKKNGPPCWMHAPCDPWPSSKYRQAVGTGQNLAAADADARQALMTPFQLRLRAVAGDPAARTALEQRVLASIQLPARHQDGLTVNTLAVLDRGALAATLRTELAQLDAVLAPADPAILDNRAPLERLAVLRTAAPAARQRVAVAAALEAVAGPSAGAAPRWKSPSAVDAARQDARSLLTVSVPDGPLSGPLRRSAALRGLTLADGPGGDLTLQGARSVDEGEAAGMVKWTMEATIELQPAGGALRLIKARSVGAGADGEKVQGQVTQSFHDQVTDAVLTALDEWL